VGREGPCWLSNRNGTGRHPPSVGQTLASISSCLATRRCNRSILRSREGSSMMEQRSTFHLVHKNERCFFFTLWTVLPRTYRPMQRYDKENQGNKKKHRNHVETSTRLQTIERSGYKYFPDKTNRTPSFFLTWSSQLSHFSL